MKEYTRRQIELFYKHACDHQSERIADMMVAIRTAVNAKDGQFKKAIQRLRG